MWCMLFLQNTNTLSMDDPNNQVSSTTTVGTLLFPLNYLIVTLSIDILVGLLKNAKFSKHT